VAAKKFPQYFFEAFIVAVIYLTGLFYYGDLYKTNESQFKFYQSYFFSAVNIYCGSHPDIHAYGSQAIITNDRIDLSKISCAEIEKSPRQRLSYFNGWHDTHPIFSTLIAYDWRLLDFSWEALWPIAGSLGSLVVLSFYLILRCFGLPWYASLVIFPATIPFDLLEQNFYYLRDFSKVPFILLSFALLGILFKSPLSYKLRLSVLAASTAVIAIGIGFRQDALVLLPTIVAAAAFTSSLKSKRGILLLSGEIAAIVFCFYLANSIIGLLKTGQIEQLQGYPHFLVQGFADYFWGAAHTKIPGISFLALYSDMLAYAVVDANSSEKVSYFISFDPNYTSSGLDLVVKYASLSAADMATRVFQGLSSVSHNYWIIKPVGVWILLLLALVAVGKWRLSFFLMFAILSLAAAGSLQFSPRHSLHWIALDRALLVIITAALLGALWQYATSHLDTKIRLALWSAVAGAVLVSGTLVAGYFVQQASLSKLQSDLAKLPWFPSQEAYNARFPKNTEAIVRFTIDTNKCSGDKLQATLELEGEKVTRRLDSLGSGARYVYLAVLDPAIDKMAVNIAPQDCVIDRSWGPLGDGSIPPLQFFDPEVALKGNTIARHFRNLVSSLL
jgi:hypothetical protein